MPSPYRLRVIDATSYVIQDVDEPHYREFHPDKASALAALNEKRRSWQAANDPNPLKRFLHFHCKAARGHRVTLAEFYRRFRAKLSPREQEKWGKHSIRERLPRGLPCGPATGNVTCIGNLSFDKGASDRPRRYRLVKGKLKVCD